MTEFLRPTPTTEKSTRQAEGDYFTALLKKHDIQWDAVKFWATEVNKLIYWMTLLYAGLATTYIQNLAVFIPLFGLATLIWLFLYVRATGWYDLNFRVLHQTRLQIDKHLTVALFDDKLCTDKEPRFSTVFRGGRLALFVALFSIAFATFLFADLADALQSSTLWICGSMWISLYVSFLTCRLWLPSPPEAADAL